MKRMIEALNVYISPPCLRSALLNVFTLESSPLMLLNVILPNRIERQKEDTLSSRGKHKTAEQREEEKRERERGAKERVT